jgi:predicted ATPase
MGQKSDFIMSEAGANRLFVISGCSGSGKSTLVEALAERGEAVVREPGREIVRRELAEGGDGLPWANTQRFIDLCAARAVRDYDQHVETDRRTFFDRGIVDIVSAAESPGLVLPERLTNSLVEKRYAPVMFMSPPWEALFANDRERRHSFQDSLEEYERLEPAYRALGYYVVFLPQTSVAERVAFVLSKVTELDR